MNEDSMRLTNILIKEEIKKELYKVNTKELQSTQKIALNKVSYKDFKTKLGTINHNKGFIYTLRAQCKTVM
jgi:pyoverdine/dityrosine biosynthesis protein Dit1